MNCMFWNVRIIDTPGRKPLILHYINKTHASILGFQETKKMDFSDSYLRSLVGNRLFEWKHLPSVGSAGGILVGVDLDIFEVMSWEVRNSSISCNLKLGSNQAKFRE